MQNFNMGGMNTYNDSQGMMGGQRYSEERNRNSSDRQMGYENAYRNPSPIGMNRNPSPSGMNYPKPPGQYPPPYGYPQPSGNNQNMGNQNMPSQYGYNYPYMGQNQGGDYKSGQ